MSTFWIKGSKSAILKDKLIKKIKQCKVKKAMNNSNQTNKNGQNLNAKLKLEKENYLCTGQLSRWQLTKITFKDLAIEEGGLILLWDSAICMCLGQVFPPPSKDQATTIIIYNVFLCLHVAYPISILGLPHGSPYLPQDSYWTIS